MAEPGFHSSDSRIRWACAGFLSGRTLGHPDEIAEVQGWRLAAIVLRLKRNYGWPITTEYVGPDNGASYKLMSGTDRATLTFPPSARDLARAVLE